MLYSLSMIFAGTPFTIENETTFFVTTTPAAKTALSPIFTPHNVTEFAQIDTSLPLMVWHWELLYSLLL